MSSIAFVIKSTIRNKKKFYEELELLQNKKLFEKISVFETERKKHAIQLAQNSVLQNYQIIVAVGGDGTLNEVLNGILENNYPVDELPILAHLPYGSANDFAKVAGTHSIQDIIELLEHEKYKLIDIGLCSYTSSEGENKQRYFINILEGGIGAMVVKKVNASNKPLGVKVAFLKAITESFITYTPTLVSCKTDLENMEEKMLTLAVCNGGFLGNGLCIAPDAKIDDGLFALTCIYDISIKDYALNLRKLFKKEKIDHPKIYYSKAKTIEINPNKFSFALEGDGEFFGFAPAKIEMLHNRIKFLTK